MIRRLSLIVLWLLIGHAAWLALFWGLLQVPESSIPMLLLSAMLALLLIALAAALWAGATAAWDLDRPVLPALLAGTRLFPAAIAAGLLFGAVWWLTGNIFEWHAGIAGQIDAWVIARTGWTNTRLIHAAIFWLTTFVRWSLGVTIAVTLLNALTARGIGALKSRGWVLAALAPSRWLTVTFWFVALVAIPWQLVERRPARLSLEAEPWFVAAKLGAIAVTMAIGYALVLRGGRTEP